MVQRSVMTEAEDNNDIIVEDFHDTYLNLTLKTTYLLKWVNSNCDKTKFVFKVDDDVFVNPDRMWSTLESSVLYSVMVNIPDAKNKSKMVAENIDYALIGHVMNTIPIRDPRDDPHQRLERRIPSEIRKTTPIRDQRDDPHRRSERHDPHQRSDRRSP